MCNLQQQNHHLSIDSTAKYMGLDARKPVFGVREQQRRRPTCIISKLAMGEVSII